MQKPVLIALDPARQLGCAVGRVGGKPTLSSIKLGTARTPDEEVFGNGASTLDRVISESGAVAVAIERPFFKEGESNYGTTVLLHGLYGTFVGVAIMRGLRVFPVAVKTWRSVALGTSKFASRHAGKSASMALCAQLGWEASDDNAADAGGVWIWGTSTIAPYGVVSNLVGV